MATTIQRYEAHLECCKKAFEALFYDRTWDKPNIKRILELSITLLRKTLTLGNAVRFDLAKTGNTPLYNEIQNVQKSFSDASLKYCETIVSPSSVKAIDTHNRKKLLKLQMLSFKVALGAELILSYVADIGEKQTQGKTDSFTDEDREMLAEIYGKKKATQLTQSLGGKRGAILAKKKKTSDDPSKPTTETAAKWVLSKKANGDKRTQNAVIKDAANKFGFTECAIKRAVIRTKKRQSLPESVSPKDAKKLVAACKILGCNPTDEPQTIKSCYHQLAKTLHPDTSKKDGSQFKAVSRAWKTASEILGIK